MANLLMVPRVTPDAASADGAYKAVQGFREGSISTTTFWQRLVAAGFAYGATAGSATTPITFLTTYTALRPQLAMRGASASVMYIPMKFSVTMEAITGTVNELSILIGGGDPGNGASTVATAGPLNLRTDKPGTTATAVVNYGYTGNSTTFANPGPLEIWRASQPAADGTTNAFPPILMWNPEDKPMLAGLSGLEVFLESTTNAATGFMYYQWAETPLTWWN